ncbi:PTS system, fructose-specific IIA component [Alkalibacterium subtropicum]|uniref:PTS system, fructose-specific IIA component n=1 Tax=Alkalibacterium subtropicum TaxID=753702 RepID=A0A1I1JIT0_9LACT|nr:fructose PTS transporter subunit IIA [Alkalibacterium subtropicum]SFC48519.1 PTS system, fructose-specific IIA component [Alkalibacterium subtropicum]
MNESADRSVDYYIDPSKIFQSGKKTEIFKEMIDDVIKKSAFDFEREEVLEEIEKRESLSTTGFGNGFAIPHGKSSQIHTPIVVLMKTEQKLEWEALDDQPVSIIFLLIVPKEKGEAIHLKLLSRLSYHLMDKKIQEAFKAAETKENCEALLNQLLV